MARSVIPSEVAERLAVTYGYSGSVSDIFKQHVNSTYGTSFSDEDDALRFLAETHNYPDLLAFLADVTGVSSERDALRSWDGNTGFALDLTDMTVTVDGSPHKRDVSGNGFHGAVSGSQIDVQPRGPDLVENGDFSSSDGWVIGTGWEISGGAATCDGTENITLLRRPVAFENSKLYEVSIEVTSFTSGSMRALIYGDGYTGFSTHFSAVDTYSYFLSPSSAGGSFTEMLSLQAYPSTFGGTIDNVSAHEVLTDLDDKKELHLVLDGIDSSSVTLFQKGASKAVARAAGVLTITTPHATTDGVFTGAISDGVELITSPSFDSAAGWTLPGDMTISGGLLNIANDGTYSQASNVGSVESGKVYVAHVEVASVTAGGARLTAGSDNPAPGGFTAPGHYFVSWQATGDAVVALSRHSSGGANTLSVASVSVMEVPSSARVQVMFPDDASAPTLLIDGVQRQLVETTAPVGSVASDSGSDIVIGQGAPDEIKKIRLR